MQEHFVTVFDSKFLPQGLSLYRSMARYLKSFCLWAVCLDDGASEFISLLNYENFKPIHIRDVMTSELQSLRQQRTRAEFCWTLTPFLPTIVFERDATADRVTYLDADLWFLKSPAPIFNELEAANKGVLITSHNYSAEYDQSSRSGKFCVQFLTFYREEGEPIRKHWERQCAEWCFARFEEGKFGDQKYLDEWPDKFADQVHVLSEASFCQAPWNATKYRVEDALFFHFHAFRILHPNRFFVGAYFLPQLTVSKIYRPYIADIVWAMNLLEKCGYTVQKQAHPPSAIKGFLYGLREAVRSKSLRKLCLYIDY